MTTIKCKWEHVATQPKTPQWLPSAIRKNKAPYDKEGIRPFMRWSQPTCHSPLYFPSNNPGLLQPPGLCTEVFLVWPASLHSGLPLSVTPGTLAKMAPSPPPQSTCLLLFKALLVCRYCSSPSIHIQQKEYSMSRDLFTKSPVHGPEKALKKHLLNGPRTPKPLLFLFLNRNDGVSSPALQARVLSSKAQVWGM